MEDEPGDDKGAPFFLVVMHRPTQTSLDQLSSAVRGQFLENLTRAIRHFRSRTLPIPNSDLRMTPQPADVPLLAIEVEGLLRAGLLDGESLGSSGKSLETLGLAPTDPPRPWVEHVYREPDDPPDEPLSVDVHYAADLLGDFWYRCQNQAMELAESIEWGRKLEAARARGASIEEVQELLKQEPKPPLPPRRQPPL